MKLNLFIVFLFLFGGYNHLENTSSIVENDLELVEVPALTFNIDEVIFNKGNSRWIMKDDSSQVSGFVVQYLSGGSVARKFGVFNGRKEGLQTTYFHDGKSKFSESFKNNKLHGEVKRWILENDHQLIAHLNYQNGRLHGEQKKWYNTGELHKLMHLNMGKEEGLQQAYRKNGALYANYEARNGRVFGMKRSNLCYELDNEQVVYYQ